MIAPRNEIAWLQSNFYRDKYQKTLRLIMVSIAIMFVLIIAIMYLILSRHMPDFYANTTDGKILPMPPAKMGQ
jgi:hypothetical protein